MPPQNIEPGNTDNANTPANTGAQQRVAKAEKTLSIQNVSLEKIGENQLKITLNISSLMRKQ